MVMWLKQTCAYVLGQEPTWGVKSSWFQLNTCSALNPQSLIGLNNQEICLHCDPMEQNKIRLG